MMLWLGVIQSHVLRSIRVIIPLGVSVVKTGEDLFGEERFAADGLATEKECDELISLAKVSWSYSPFNHHINPF